MITEFSHWIPPSLVEARKTPKAIIVLTPPSQADGRREVETKVWQDFATKHNCALVGCYFQDDVPTGIEEYCNVRDTPSAARQLANYLWNNFHQGDYTQPPHPPLLMWGFSAGGQFNYEFTAHTYKRVIGFVVNKGGIYYTHLAPPATRAIPALWIVGEKDSPWRVKSVEGIWGVNTVAGAAWDLHREVGVGHSVGDSLKLGQDFFTTILEKM